jgi:RNA polymerase sigma-70 factor (ECF subfamily)
MNLIDSKLWDLCIKGDIDAFQELYDRFYPVMYNYGIKLTQNKETVKDCIHDLFIKIIKNHRKLSPTDHLKSYLIKSFRNLLYDLLEKQKTTDDISDYENEFTVDDLFSSLFGEEYTSDADTEYLKKAMKTLPSHQQEILYLHFVNGLKHEEIAAVLGINYQSSKNLLFRSLSKLRRLFENRE